jgi:hypothetical protein
MRIGSTGYSGEKRRIKAPRPSCPSRQERRGKRDAILDRNLGGPIAQLGTLHRHYADPCLDQTSALR